MDYGVKINTSQYFSKANSDKDEILRFKLNVGVKLAFDNISKDTITQLSKR